MRPWILLNVIWALERKEINEWKLEEQYREGDDLEPEDLPEHERPKKPIDFENVCYFFLRDTIMVLGYNTHVNVAVVLLQDHQTDFCTS